ncbi:DUF3618 domain-containing protein [uncultured Roseobacter sp.]|uniref:DUF3618 domain-containing protein n=1 Tax=uncultured Roseobacter sp. TaxID=114847 RepID=UPI0026226A29|nr:DUF3618 domain-containing protein [uncultured Roseobacter sp.]
MSDSIRDIERDIETDRSLLERSLSQLAQALSPGQVSGTVAREMQMRGGAVSHAAIDMVRANPAGAALVGIGVAALLAGPKKRVPEPPYDTRSTAVAQGQSGDDPLSGEFDARVAAADAEQSSEPVAPRLRAALNDGLANLPAPARERVIRARKAAIEAQEKLDRKAGIAARRARSFHHRQPLSTGALALGLGAVVAALLPRTRIEDDLLGARRDALLQEAELVLRDELAQATATGEAALRDGLRAGQERLRGAG